MNSTLLNASPLNAKFSRLLAATMAGLGTVTASAVVVFAASAALAGAGTLTPALTVQPVLKATSGLNAYRLNAPVALNARQGLFLSCVMSGDSTVHAAATLEMAGAATLAGAGTLQGALGLDQYAAATLAGEGGLTATLRLTYQAAAALTGEAALIAQLTTPFHDTDTFSAGFLTEAAKKNGTRPLCLLYFDLAAGRVFASDRAETGLGSWTGGPAINAWVKRWGTVDDVASLDLSAAPVLAGDLTIDFQIQDGIAGSGTLWTQLMNATNVPEQTKVRLYLWFRDLNPVTDPPVALWEGTIRDWRWTDEQTLQVQFGDAVERYDRPVGRPVTLVNFPNCDPDDVGKQEPILYGSLERVPCLAIDAGPNSPLAQDLTAAAAALYFSNQATAFAPSGTVILDAEQIGYSGVTTEALNGVTHGKLTGLSRGANGTTAVAHNKGAVLVQAQSAYKYLVAGHACRAVSKVYVEDERGNPVLQGGNYTVGLNENSFPDGIPRTVVTFSVLPKLTRQVNLAALAQETIAVTKAGTVQDGIGVGDNIGVSASPITTSLTQQPSGSFPRDFSSWGGGPVIILTFPAAPAAIISQTVTIEAEVLQSCNDTNNIFGGAFSLSTGAAGAPYVLKTEVVASGVSVLFGRQTCTISIQGGGNTVSLGGVIVRTGFSFTGQAGLIRVYQCSRVVTYQQTPAIAKTGAASRSGAVTENITTTKSGTVTVQLTGNTAADTVIGGRVLVDCEGYQDDAAGTYTGSPNALIQLSRDVLRHVLSVHMGFAPTDLQLSAGLAADMGSTYKLEGAIVEPILTRALVSRLAFESGCWLKLAKGKPTLIFRKRVVVGAFTLANGDVAFIQRTKQTCDIQKMPVDWILNKIELRYDRDWGQARSFEAYRKIEVQQDSASRNRYGIKARPDLFMCDFIRSAAHAQAVGALYLSIHKTRRDLITLRTFLMRQNLQFGDRLTVNNRMLSNQVGELVGVNFTPGSAVEGRMPEFTLTVLALDAS